LLEGSDKSVELNASLFEAISKHWFHLGSVGAGSRFKLVHNMVLGLNRLVLAEGLEFARSLGMDGAKTLEILKQTPAYSTVMESKGDRMVNRDFENPQARLSQHLKDVRSNDRSGTSLRGQSSSNQAASEVIGTSRGASVLVPVIIVPSSKL
jgi:3-hydroxyisobutyrate dehydrogenase-like beta-hydroxyacid dehydrogenase